MTSVCHESTLRKGSCAQRHHRPNQYGFRVATVLVSPPMSDSSTPEKKSIARPPVIVVMGHVDHGKSSLLDYIRKSNIVAGEAGGITQHMGAYEVMHTYEGGERKITFLDTPGHAAFGAIRSRGAKVADIGILVVSAEDGVKAQTLEARAAIETAGIPYIVAMNKIDKPNADINRTHATLIEHGIYVEGMGGTIPWCAISAKTGKGIPELLDTLLLLADVSETMGDSNARAEGTVIEAHHDPKRGTAATIVIKDGTLKQGQFVCAGTAIAPVRLMEDSLGKKVESATFSAPVRLTGFDQLPEVGSTITVWDTKREAEAARKDQPIVHTSLWTGAEDGRLLIPLIVKCDVIGSLEAIEGAVNAISNDRVSVRIVQKGIGAVTEVDMKVALTSIHSLIIAFGVPTDSLAKDISMQHGLKIYDFNIIYRLTEWLTDEIKRVTPKRKEKQVMGSAKVLKRFSEAKKVKTLGCKILEGEIRTEKSVVISRRGEHLGDGKIVTLQAARQSVTSVMHGNECGLQVETDVDVLEGDTLTYVEMVET
jgi:translation initiation factor IF-2